LSGAVFLIVMVFSLVRFLQLVIGGLT